MTKKRTKQITPIGIARYPRLNAPDTKFDASGIFKIGLKLLPPDSLSLKKVIDEAMEDSYQEALKQERKKKRKAGEMLTNLFFLKRNKNKDKQGEEAKEEKQEEEEEEENEK